MTESKYSELSREDKQLVSIEAIAQYIESGGDRDPRAELILCQKQEELATKLKTDPSFRDRIIEAQERRAQRNGGTSKVR